MDLSPRAALRNTWRDTLGNHIYLGTKSPAWTDQDRRAFLVYAARYQWTQTLQHNDVGCKELQKELMMYTTHRGLNHAILVDMVHAVRAKLQEVHRECPNLYQWPQWTRRWFLDPWWDGDTVEPRAYMPGPRLDLFLSDTRSDVGRRTIDVLANWDHMIDAEKNMCFEAARSAAQQGSSAATVLGGQYPIRRMAFALPGLE